MNSSDIPLVPPYSDIVVNVLYGESCFLCNLCIMGVFYIMYLCWFYIKPSVILASAPHCLCGWCLYKHIKGIHRQDLFTPHAFFLQML